MRVAEAKEGAKEEEEVKEDEEELRQRGMRLCQYLIHTLFNSSGFIMTTYSFFPFSSCT